MRAAARPERRGERGASTPPPRARQSRTSSTYFSLAVPQTPSSLACAPQESYARFQASWDAAAKKGEPRLRSVLIDTWGKELMLAGACGRSSAGLACLFSAAGLKGALTIIRHLASSLAGLFKLLWSCVVIMGAFFFVRTLQFHVNRHPSWNEAYKGWVLAVAFFLDAYVLGECARPRPWRIPPNGQHPCAAPAHPRSSAPCLAPLQVSPCSA